MKRYFISALIIFTIIIFCQAPQANCAQDRTAVFTVGQSSYTVDGQTNGMDAETFVENSHTYVPLRYLAYAIGIADRGIGCKKPGAE